MRFHKSRSVETALSVLQHAVESVEPGLLVRKSVNFAGSKLTVHDISGNSIKVNDFDRAYIVGAGKANARMAAALCLILKDRVASGAITIPYGEQIELKGISVTPASHPVPDRSGIAGTNKIIEVLKKAKENDLVFVLISGGGSSLMPLPAKGVTLADKQKITALLLKSGASIQEINIVRKHLSAIKGGRMVQYAKCKIISLILSDVVGDDLQIISSGPTVPDCSTFGDALDILKKYRVKYEPVVNYVVDGAKGQKEETPKEGDPIFKNVRNMLIGNNQLACDNATMYLKKKGFETINLGSGFSGEALEFGRLLAGIASNLAAKSPMPFAAVAGGETTVKLKTTKNGMGGRNQEAVLSCIANLSQIADITVACVGTDGIDGNSKAAGGIASTKTISMMANKKLDIRKYLKEHDSYRALRKLNSLIITGPTGTNVSDIAIICKLGSYKNIS